MLTEGSSVMGEKNHLPPWSSPVTASRFCMSLLWLIVFCARCALDTQDLRKFLSPMRKKCARLYLFLQCAIYAQDLCKIVLLFAYCILRKMRKLRIGCAITGQENFMRKLGLSFLNAQYRRKISPQCTIYAQDLRKIVLLSPLGNIYLTDTTHPYEYCTYFQRVGYFFECPDILASRRNYAKINTIL